MKRAGYLAELDVPEFPVSLTYLWTAFHRLRNRKGNSGMGLSPIEWPDIDAFMRSTRMPLAPWEIEVIEDLDDIYLASVSKGASGG